MYVLVTYRNEENSYILDAQGQLTLQLVDGCGGKSNSNFYGSPSYLQMRKIHSKMKVLEWSQQISHCKSMQIFYDAQGNLTTQSKVDSILN